MTGSALVMPEAMRVPQKRIAQVKFSLAKTTEVDQSVRPDLSKNDKLIRKVGSRI